MHFDVCGLGNALMDVLVRIPDEETLTALGLRKGIMHLVDEPAWQRAWQHVEMNPRETSPGGSCANAISTLALLGARVRFCGQVSDDWFGQTYSNAITTVCGGHSIHLAPYGATGKCLSLITPDAERTMLTTLGSAIDLAPEHLFREVLPQAETFHLTGYLFTGGRMGETAREALEIARAHGIKVSFDVADPFVVRFHRDVIQEIIERYVDILFLNEEEARSLTELDPREAAAELSRHVGLVAIKLGMNGSLLRAGDEVVHVPVYPVRAVDSTGAGDAYAGALLYGLSRKFSLERAGHLASRVAAETVAQTGAVVHTPGLLAQIAAVA